MTHVPYVALTRHKAAGPRTDSCHAPLTLRPSRHSEQGAVELRNSEARAGPRPRVRSRLPGRGGDYETATNRNTRYRFNIAYRSGKPVTRVRGARWTRRVRSRAQRRARTFFDLVNFTPVVPWLRSVETCTRQGGAWSYHTVHPTATPPRLAFVVTVSGAFTRSIEYGSAEHRGETASTPVIFGRVRVGDSLVL